MRFSRPSLWFQQPTRIFFSWQINFFSLLFIFSSFFFFLLFFPYFFRIRYLTFFFRAFSFRFLRRQNNSIFERTQFSWLSCRLGVGPSILAPSHFIQTEKPAVRNFLHYIIEKRRHLAANVRKCRVAPTEYEGKKKELCFYIFENYFDGGVLAT